MLEVPLFVGLCKRLNVCWVWEHRFMRIKKNTQMSAACKKIGQPICHWPRFTIYFPTFCDKRNVFIMEFPSNHNIFKNSLSNCYCSFCCVGYCVDTILWLMGCRMTNDFHIFHSFIIFLLHAELSIKCIHKHSILNINVDFKIYNIPMSHHLFVALRFFSLLPDINTYKLIVS